MATTIITTAGNAAAARVFAVPELLENILINLSPVDLYQVQIVDKTFQATISGSPQLQKKMHLERLDDSDHNTKLLSDIRTWKAVLPFIIDPIPDLDIQYLQPHFSDLIDEWENVIGIEIDFEDNYEEPHYLTNLVRQPAMASWRKIKIGSPGQNICVTLNYWSWSRGGLRSKYFVRKGGRTYGELIDACVAKLGIDRRNER